jgi:hypothetical protein
VNGFEACRRGLALLGLDVPERDEDALDMYLREREAIAANVAGRSAADIAALPDIEDHEVSPAARLLLGLSTLSAFAAHRNVHGWVNSWMTNTALRSGNSKASTVAYARASAHLADRGEYDLARTLGEVTLLLCRRYDDPSTSGRALFAYLGVAANYQTPLAELIPLHSSVLAKCMETGDLMFAGYISVQLQYCRLASGIELSLILADIDAHMQFLRRSTPNIFTGHYVPHIVLPICELMDIPIARFGLVFDHDAHVAKFGSARYLMSWYNATLIKLDCLYGRPVSTDELLHRLEIIESGGLGFLLVRESRYYAILMLLDPNHAQPLDASMQEHIDAWRSDLARCAARCPSNFGHLLALIDAELAREHGESLDDALSRYEQAIDEARLRGATHQEALACYRFAEFWATRGSKRTALIYLETARDLYEAWGAASLVRKLDARRAELQPPRPGSAR